jgi:hypothetical protein
MLSRLSLCPFTNCAAIQWKASQKKDRRNIQSEHSEDALTWQVFRSLETTELLDRFVSESLGLEDHYVVYYWQRRHHQHEIDPGIDQALAEVEPYHHRHSRQHTETDLILRGKHILIVTEVKLGSKRRKITGWCQSKGSPIVSDYEPHAHQFIRDMAQWRHTMTRFAQLYKNLFLGKELSKLWFRAARPLPLHLLVVVNGATQEIQPAPFGSMTRTLVTDRLRARLSFL